MDTDFPQRRPMSAGQIIDAAFRLYQENAGLFIGTLAVLLVPQAILDLISRPLSAVSILTSTYSLGALILAIGARDQGRPITIGEAYSSLGFGTFVMLLVTNIVAAIIIAISLVLLIIPGIYVLVRLAFIDPVVVLERTGIGEALSRSWGLVRGSWWRAFGIGLLVFILTGLVEGVVGGILSFSFDPRLGNAIGVIVGIIVQPFAVSALVLLYYDLRIRKEGAVV